MKRNWNYLRNMQCPLTRAALMSCDDPIVLKQLMKAFPDAFLEGEEIATPWSVLYETAFKAFVDHFARVGSPWHVNKLRQFALYDWYSSNEKHIPHARHFGECKEAEATIIPARLQEKLREMPNKPPLRIEYEGEKWVIGRLGESACVWIPAFPDGLKQMFCTLKTGRHDRDQSGMYPYVTLVPERFVVFDL